MPSSRCAHTTTRARNKHLGARSLVCLLLLVAIAACGSTPTAEAPAAPASTTVVETPLPIEATPNEAATSVPDVTQAPVAAEQPTGVPAATCEPDQKRVVWMVRNGVVENEWETNIVRPAFEAAHPDICLDIISLNQEDVALKREAMIASGELLHVWSSNWGGNGFTNDRVRGLVEDLTPLIQRDNLDLSVFLPDALKTYQFDGKTYGLPFLATGSYIYYNKKMFDAAGVPYPPVDWNDTSWTWDAFVETAKKLTKNIDDINTVQYGAAPNIINGNLEFPPSLWGHDIFPPDAYQQGYSGHVNVTNDKSIAAYQAFHDLIYVHKVAPDTSAAQALEQLGGAFASGKVAMQMSGGWGHWAWKDLYDDPAGFCWGVAPFPMGSPDATMRGMTFTDPWVITEGLPPEELELAWTFVKFLVSPEQAAAYSEATGTPPTQTALLEDYYQSFSKCMDPADMKTVFEGSFTNGRPGSLSQFVRADEYLQTWNNTYPTLMDDPNAKAADILPTLEQQTNDVSDRIEEELESMAPPEGGY